MFVRSLAIGVSAAALMVGGAQAADLIIPTTPQPIMQTSSGFDWEGLYIGARAGALFADDVTVGAVGAVAGVNFIPADPILLGVEVSGDYVFGDDIVENFGEFFANARVGAVVTDSALVYALGGVGFRTADDDSVAVYQLGGGVEFAVTDAITVRGELVGQGTFDDGDDDFFENAKATVGVFYHF